MNTSITGFLLVLLFVCSGCDHSETQAPIVKEQEVTDYLNTEKFQQSVQINRIEDNISFWRNKLKSDPSSITYRSKLGAALIQHFDVKRDIRDLNKAGDLLKAADSLSGIKNAERLQALSNLAIKKHQFREAYRYARKALDIGDEESTSHLLLFDTMMERGEAELAKRHLDKVKNPYNFAYLIRRARYKDYRGQLDSAIYYMEKAQDIAAPHSRLAAWTAGTLGDMYGHAGKVQKSYRLYRKVLQMEHTGDTYLHSLKGIAWIAFAHDRNTTLAVKILNFVDRQVESPDVRLTLADIAAFEGDRERKKRYLRAFVEEAQKPDYRGMYDTRLIEIAATELNDTDRAMELVEKELINRPAPGIYDLKAWVYLKQGHERKALETARKHVEGETYEPLPAYHMAHIYLANGKLGKATEYFSEAVEAGFELGPAIKRIAENKLLSLKNSPIASHK